MKAIDKPSPPKRIASSALFPEDEIATLLQRIGGRARRVLKQLHVRKVKDLLALRMEQVFSVRSSGPNTWEEIQGVQTLARRRLQQPIITQVPDPTTEALRPETIPEIPDEHLLSFDHMLRYWLSTACETQRECQILEMRLAVGRAKVATLEECGAAIGVTRERVRQIEKQALEGLRRPPVLARLLRFWASVLWHLEGAGGILSLQGLAELLQQEYHWSRAPDPTVLEAILLFCTAFIVSENTVQNKDQTPCLECPRIQQGISQLMKGMRSLPVSEITPKLPEYCNDCPSPQTTPPRAFSAAYISHVVRSDKGLSTGFKLCKDVLYSIQEWTICYGRASRAAIALLEQSGRPMHHTAVTAELRRRLPGRRVNGRQIHTYLTQSKSALLWDRGTFIHKKHVSPSRRLVREIVQWISRELRNGIPCMSVSRAFQAYSQQCRSAGMASETALFSCLKMTDGETLAYPRYPYIQLRSRGDKYTPPYLIVEEWIREADAPVSSKRLEKFVCDDMGLKPFQLTNIRAKLPNVIQNDQHEYVHTTSLSFDKEDIAPLVAHARQLLSKYSSVSVMRLYRDKAVTCHQLGISGPRMLFNILREFATDTLNCNGYPTVTPQTIHDAGHWRSILAEVEVFIRDKGGPCTSDEIAEEFVERLGYRSGSVFSVVNRENVFRYLHGCLVHREVIEWTPHKESRLETILHDAYLEASAAGAAYAEIARLLELSEGDLPALGQGLLWTPTLLADLTRRSAHFTIIGTAENAFVEVPNDLKIQCLSGLVELILRNEYSGAANHEEFTELLRARKIVKRNLTSSMLGEQSAVTIIGHEIVLKELL